MKEVPVIEENTTGASVHIRCRVDGKVVGSIYANLIAPFRWVFSFLPHQTGSS